MLEILQNIISILTNDTTLNAIVPPSSIYTGPVDVVQESQASLTYPMIVLSIASESMRSIPTNARDTVVQLDIYSRNSQLEIENIYERIVFLLAYVSANSGSAHIFWEKVGGARDSWESERRLWRRAVDIPVWAIK